MRARPQQVEDLLVEPLEAAADVPRQQVVPATAESDGAVGQLLGKGAVTGFEIPRGLREGQIQPTAPIRRADRQMGRATGLQTRGALLRASGRFRGAQSSIPRSGDEGTATPRAGIRPANHASRPASTA